MKGLWSALALLPLAVIEPLAAQGVDVIRGQVTSPENLPLENANVTATSVSGGVTRAARTDRAGRFTITFAGGDGDYWIVVTSIGYRPRRFEVKRTSDQDILVADVRLARAAALLDTVSVSASRGRVGRNSLTPDVGGSERAVAGTNVPADRVGDLNAMAASLAGVQPVYGADSDPAGFSVLGLSAEQNLTTLNGGAFAGGSLPRDATVTVSLSQGPYDVSRGGFSGAQLNVVTPPGSNFIRRTNSVNLDSPRAQWADAAARALGAPYSSVSLGGLMSGPIQFDKSFYNVSYQLGRRSSDLHTLLATDLLRLAAAGIAADSVARLLSIAERVGIPTGAGRLGDHRRSEQGLLFGSLDFAPPSSATGQAFSVIFSGGWNRQTPSGALTTELPAHGGDRTSWRAGGQLRHNAYVADVVLSESSLNLVRSRTFGTPYASFPNGSVLVSSQLPDGGSGVALIGFGGNAVLGVSQQSGVLELRNQLSWFSIDNRHRLKLSSEVRRDDFTIDQATNQLGTFTFNSLADLEAGRPASFTRQLSSRLEQASQLTGALALGDSYQPTGSLQVQYGIRLDGNRFTTAPAFNPDVESRFLTRNDHTPSKVYVSPRLGFSWAYGTARQIAGMDDAVRGPRAVLRGGVGVFQNMPNAAVLSASLASTGLIDGLQRLACVGAAAATPDWGSYSADLSTIPTRCADGTAGSAFVSTAPNVTLFAHGWSAPRSLRGTLNWQGPVLDNRLTATIEGTYSLNLNQASSSDLNFAPVTQFTLADEDDRPVFEQVGSIVPGTGAIAGRESRVARSYAHVTELRSDLRSRSRQVRLQLAPSSFSSSVAWGLGYVYGQVREQSRGFSSTGHNPLDVEWSRGALDSRHQILYHVGYNFFDAVRVTWFGQFRSGMPFTPDIAGDVNGDGYSSDRAFVFDPGATTDATLAAQMRALLASGSNEARDCLSRQLGRLAARNSCEGPWTSDATLAVALNPLKLRLPQRASVQFQLGNPLGAADLVLHGEKKLRGWGHTTFPDPRLFFVRGFDPTARRYRYEVNPRFGDGDPRLVTVRAHVTLTALVRIDVGPTRERQSLTQTLDRGRTRSGSRITEEMLKSAYGTAGLLNPIARLLRQSDTLSLTGAQADSLATMNLAFTGALDSIWSDVARELAALPTDYDQGEAYRRYARAREASVDLLIALAPRISRLLTDRQKRILPTVVTAHLDPRYLAGIRSGTAGTAAAGAFTNSVLGATGTPVQRTDIIIARPP